MSDDDTWLKNPILPRPAAVPYFEPEELAGVPDSDRRFIARSYASNNQRERSQRIGKVDRTALESKPALLRRMA
jgi:hypothetical protein